jgi:hypothetical protein
VEADHVTVRQLSQGRRASGALLALLTTAVVLSACGGGPSGGAPPLVRVSERDFKIQAPRTVRAGVVRLRLSNRGPDTHELLVVRLGGPLPLRRDGLTVDEDALEPRIAATVEGVERGGAHEERVKLPPGQYILFCNMAGHYLAGMHARLTVR